MSGEKGRSDQFNSLYNDYGAVAQYQCRDMKDYPSHFDNGYSDNRFHEVSSTSQKPITQLLEKSSHSERPRNSLEGLWSSVNITCAVTKPVEEESISNVFKNTDPDDDYVYKKNLEVEGESMSKQTGPLLCILCKNPECPRCSIIRIVTRTDITKTKDQKVKEATDEKADNQNILVRDKVMTSSESSRERSTTSKYSYSYNSSKKKTAGSMVDKSKENGNKESENTSSDNKEWINTENQITEKPKFHEIDLNESERKDNESSEIQKQYHTRNKENSQNDRTHNIIKVKQNEQEQSFLTDEDLSPKDTEAQDCNVEKLNESNGLEDHYASGIDLCRLINNQKSENKYNRGPLSSTSSGCDHVHDHNYTESFLDDSYKQKHSETRDFADDLNDDDEDYYYEDSGSYLEERDTIDDKTAKNTEDTSLLKTSTQNDSRYSRGVKQFHNMPIFMKSIRKFAKDNGFEIRDGIPDGNCMFRAIVDQMMINGDFSFTPFSLRKHAIRYLRENPYHTDGSHLESFVSTETWSEYLIRMEKTSQWGDHIMLKAISDAFNLVVVVFNVYDDDIRRTEIQPVNTKTWRKTLSIHLGHIGEFHYLSLRKSNWETAWPYTCVLCTENAEFSARIRRWSRVLEAVVQRFQTSQSDERSGCTELCIQQHINQMGIRRYTEKAEFRSSKSDATAEKSLLKSNGVDPKATTDQLEVHNNNKTLMDRNYPSVETHGLQKRQMEESEESLRLLFEDPLHIDVLTGIPIPHLSFIIRQTIPMALLRNVNTIPPESRLRARIEVIDKGSSSDGTNVFFVAAKKDNEMIYYHELKKFKKIKRIVCCIDYEVVYSGISFLENFDTMIIADSSSTYPGYCRLMPLDTTNHTWGNQIYHEGSIIYLKGFPKSSFNKQEKNYIPAKGPQYDRDRAEGAINSEQSITAESILGFKCLQFPPCAREWEFRDRPSGWPAKPLVDEILLNGCTVIQAYHPNSNKPTIEWKFIFTKSEQILLGKGFQEPQKYAFLVFKIVIEYMTRHMAKQLKNKHFKSIFFYASEKIPQDVWEHSLSGCIMYLCSTLLEGLRKKIISHYFISTCNLLDGYSDEEIETISIYVESFRLFPVQSIHFMCERHGYNHTLTRVNPILKDSKKFANDKDLNRAFLDVFLPCLIRMFESFLDSMSYENCYRLIKENYETLLITPVSSQSFKNGPSFEVFFQKALRTLKNGTIKEQLTKLYQKDCGGVLQIHNGSKKYVKDFVTSPIDERVGSREVPKEYSTDISLVASYLDNLGYQYFISGNSEMAFLFVKEAIRCIKQALADSIDVSSITDKSLKVEVGLQQTFRATVLNATLCDYYDHMFQACQMHGRLENIREHMTDMEEVCERVPFLKRLVSRIWKALGDTERSYLFKIDDEVNRFS